MDLYHIIAHAILMKNCTTLVIKICFRFFVSAYISTIAYISTPHMGDPLRILEKKFEQNRSRTLREEAVDRKKVYILLTN